MDDFRATTGKEAGASDAKQREFAEHLQRIQARLYSYIHIIVRDMNDADDLLQQTSIVLWRKYDAFDPSRDFFNWACGVARLEARNFLRTRKSHRLVLSDQLDQLLADTLHEMPTTEREDRRQALADCIEKLGGKDRDLIEQCYTRRAPVREVAASLSRTPQSVHNSLKRLRGWLLDCIRRSLASEAHAT
ncbi:MAG: sigma-70 family RNA polymerase sigma factor [Planctomycetota bacterium]